MQSFRTVKGTGEDTYIFIAWQKYSESKTRAKTKTDKYQKTHQNLYQGNGTNN